MLTPGQRDSMCVTVKDPLPWRCVQWWWSSMARKPRDFSLALQPLALWYYLLLYPRNSSPRAVWDQSFCSTAAPNNFAKYIHSLIHCLVVKLSPETQLDL